jgi:HEAT repeat protein
LRRRSEVRFAAGLALAAIGDWEKIDKELLKRSPTFSSEKSIRGRGLAPEIVAELIKEIDKSFGSGSPEQIKTLKQKLLGGPPSRALVPAISAYLTSEHPESRKAAAEILGRWGYPECAAALAAALNGPGPIDREAVIIALGRTRQADVVPLIARETVSENREIRIAAIYALSYTPGRMARDILARLSDDPDRFVSGMAVSCLSAFPDRSLTPIFRRALKHGNPLTRFSAVTWFGTYRTKPESMALVARIDRETDPNVNAAIIRAISRWKGQSDPVLLGRYLTAKHPRKVRVAVAEALGKYKSQLAAHALLRAFRAAAGKPEQAVIYLEHLGKTGDKIGLALLVKLLSDPAWQSPALKKQVVRALGHLGAQTASARIAKLLTPDTDKKVLIAAVEALGRIGGPAAGTELVGFVRKTETPLSAKRAALEWIVKSGNREGISLVRAWLSDPELATAAIKALVELDTQRLFPSVCRLIKGDSKPAVKIECIEILAGGGFKPSVFDAPLTHSLNDENESVRLASAAALIRRGSIIPLKKAGYLKVKRIGETISKLEEIARFEAIRRLVKALDSSDIMVRNTARFVLARLAASGSDTFVLPPSDDLSPGEEKERIKAWKTWYRRNKPRLTPTGE